ncbi:hypothetical protein BGZ65_003820, partial [Modicella reniformis]
KNSSSSIQTDFNNEQNAQDHSSSNTQILVPATNKRKKEEECEIENEANSKSKRPRKPLQLQKKLEIIAFWEANQNMSMTEISKKFDVPRTTIYGIIKNKDILNKLAKSQPNAGLNLERYRKVEPRFRILEELLVAWSLDLKSRSITVTGKKLTSQAFEIHRMLSDMFVGSLPACTFSSGWLKRFKERRKSSLEAANNAYCPVDQDKFRLFVEDHLRHFSGSLDDIYTCGLTNMYLDMLPSRIYDGSSQELPRSTVDTENALIRLCCNASGTDMIRPHVIMRGILDDPNFQTLLIERKKLIRADEEDRVDSSFKEWLTKFDRGLNRPIVLFLDQAVWDTLTNGLWRLNESQQLLQSTPMGASKHSQSFEASLKYITIVKVPTPFAACLPTAVGLVKEFKRNYLRSCLEEYAQKRATTIFKYLRLIRHAWRGTRGSTVQHSFETILGSTSQSPVDQLKPSLDTHPPQTESDILQAVKKACPSMPDTMLQYYLTQDNDIGPSGFLRKKIHEMRHHEDFMGCLGPHTSNQMRDYDFFFSCSSSLDKIEKQQRIQKRVQKLLQNLFTHFKEKPFRKATSSRTKQQHKLQ